VKKYAQTFVLGHNQYLFQKAHSFSGALLSENCLLPRTDNVPRQISELIFSPDGADLSTSKH